MTFLAALILFSAALNVVLAVTNVRNSRRNAANARANETAARLLQRQAALFVKPTIKIDTRRFTEEMARISKGIERAAREVGERHRRPLS